MNTIQYWLTRRALVRDISLAINALAPSTTKAESVALKDTTRNEQYILYRYGQNWVLDVVNANGSSSLQISYYSGRVAKIGGDSINGRITHIVTVPNAHTLGMVAQLLSRL